MQTPATANSLPSGHNALIRSYFLLGHKGIRLWAIIPVLLNIAIFSVAMFWLAGFAESLEQLYLNVVEQYLGAIPLLGSLFSWLAIIIQPLIFLSASIFFFYFFSNITQLLAAPFNALLSESVEKTFSLTPASEDNPISFFTALKRTLPRELYKLYKSIKWLLLMLVFMFVPGLNLLVPVIGAWLLAIDYLDIPADNRGLGFKASLQLIQKNPLRHLCFGFSVYLACLIPIINFFVVPAATVAGTLLWHKISQEKP